MSTQTSTDAAVDTINNLISAPASAAKIPYVLYYRQGNNPYPQFFVFFHGSKDLRKVVDRSKRHCELMNYRFVSVKPLIVDFAEAEARQFNRGEEYQDRSAPAEAAEN